MCIIITKKREEEGGCGARLRRLSVPFTIVRRQVILDDDDEDVDEEEEDMRMMLIRDTLLTMNILQSHLLAHHWIQTIYTEGTNKVEEKRLAS